MKVFLSEIKESDLTLHYTEKDPWVLETTRKADEVAEPKNNKSSTPLRPIEVDFTLRRVDETFTVDGSIQADIHLLCSRCAARTTQSCDHRFFLIFSKDPKYLSTGHRLFHPHTDEDSEAPSVDIDVTLLEQDFIDLKEILTEQLQLQVPFQPLCRENCKGMCQHCGADLNQGRCACAAIVKDSPFAALVGVGKPKDRPSKK